MYCPLSPLNETPQEKPARRAFVQSIKKTASFKAVYKRGRQAVNAYFVMYALPSPEGNRLGVTVSKKVGKAVVRNRIRRLVKERFRLNAHILKPGFDIVVVARAGADAISYHKVDKALGSLLDRLKLYKSGEK